MKVDEKGAEKGASVPALDDTLVVLMVVLPKLAKPMVVLA